MRVSWDPWVAPAWSVPSPIGCRPSGSKQWAELGANGESIDSHRQGKSQVQNPKETESEMWSGTRLQCGSEVHPGDRTRDKYTYSTALAGSGLKWGSWAHTQGWWEFQMRLVRVTKTSFCPQGPEMVNGFHKVTLIKGIQSGEFLLCASILLI